MSDLSTAISLIIKGDVVIIPTEGSYCYVADPFNIKAVEKLKTLSESQSVKQDMSILIGDLDELTTLVQSFESKDEKRIVSNWPGEKTLVFNYPSNFLSKDLLYKNKQLALRLPSEEFLLEILHGVGQPLACVNIFEEQVLVKNSLHFKNSELFCLKVQQSLTGNLPEIIE